MTSIVDKKYYIRTVLFMTGYVLVNLAAITGAFDDIKSPGSWFFALVVAAPIAGHLWALLVWMRDSDEFVRALAAKRFIFGTGITLALLSAWGFMEIYANAPHFPVAMIVPFFWLAWAGVSPFIQTSH
jgi:putative oxidoreductase